MEIKEELGFEALSDHLKQISDPKIQNPDLPQTLIYHGCLLSLKVRGISGFYCTCHADSEAQKASIGKLLPAYRVGS